MKITFIDDESMYLKGIELLLSTEEKIDLIKTYDSPIKFLEELKENKPDIIFVDIQMKEMDGYKLVEEIKGVEKNIPIIVLSSSYYKASLKKMTKLGIAAFLPKTTKKEVLLEAIEEVKNKGVFFTEEDYKMLSAIVQNKKENTNRFDSKESLTKREKEVLELICEEKTNQQIADQLFLSKRTVESHRQRILEKIGVRNTVGLVIYAIVNGFYEPESKYFSDTISV